MAYSVKSKKSGETYYLHAKTTETKGGSRTLYYFGKQIKEGALDELPADREVTESEATGLPILKKKAA